MCNRYRPARAEVIEAQWQLRPGPLVPRWAPEHRDPNRPSDKQDKRAVVPIETAGLAKNHAQLLSLFGLANLAMAKGG